MSGDAAPELALPQAFRAWADASADAPMVATHERSMTVGEVASLAGGLADRLGDLARGPVIVAANDGIELTVATLAVIAHGGRAAFFDPRRSSGALEEFASLTGARCVITSAPLSSRLPVVPPLEQAGDGYRPESASLDDVYALLSTSGSTGAPKIIEATHASVWQRAFAYDAWPPNRRDDRMLVPFSPTTGMDRLFGYALQRIPVVSLDPRVVPMSRFLPLAASQGVTQTHLVTSLARRIAAATPPGTTITTLRSLALYGEAALWSDVALLRPLLSPQTVIVNGYGSTETSLITQRLIPADEPLGVGALPIGRPVAGRSVWIDAGDGVPAEHGTVGEIVVDGPFGKNDARFVPLEDGRLRYRTGDLGMFDADGDLHHHGRVDRMLKIGGVRVEPSAVETVLRGLPGVRDVAIIPIDLGAEHGHRLAAHVVTDPGHPPTIEALRAGASELLPSPAVPARFILHTDALPLLPSGKTDRMRLQTLTV